MSDLTHAIQPKSDQLNADDLISGPLTLTITGVSVVKTPEQPVAISYDGDGGRPWKPCKSMTRVLVQAWGPDSTKFVGRSVTLYRDPTVKWGGLDVGGIRISHMSHIPSVQTMALTVTRGNKRPFTVKPLAAPKGAPVFAKAPGPAPRYTALFSIADGNAWLDELRRVLTYVESETEVAEVRALDPVARALASAPDDVVRDITALLDDAKSRVLADPDAAHEPVTEDVA